MSLFSKKKDVAAQTFVLRLVNSNCPALAAMFEGPRTDSRARLVLVVTIIPIANDRLQIDRGFTAVTKEFSKEGVAVVLDERLTLDQALLGFRLDGKMTFLRGKAKHLDAMGGGFYQLGFHLLDVVTASDYPELKPLSV